MYRNCHLTIFQIFICITCTTLCFAQTEMKSKAITIRCKNMPLRSVINDIADQSGFDFVFSDVLVDEKMITCDIKNLEIEDALHLIMSQFQISYKIYSGGSIVLLGSKNPLSILERKSSQKMIQFTHRFSEIKSNFVILLKQKNRISKGE